MDFNLCLIKYLCIRYTVNISDYSFPGADRGGFTRLGIHCVALQLHSEPKKKTPRKLSHGANHTLPLFPWWWGVGGWGGLLLLLPAENRGLG